MKVLLTVHTYWPEKNGVQYVAQYMAEGLAQLGHEITVLTNFSPNSMVQSEEVHNGVKIIRRDLRTKFTFIVGGKRELKRVFNEYASGSNCIINMCVQSPINNMILPLLKKYGCKKVLYMHGRHSFQIDKSEKDKIKVYIKHILLNIRWGLYYLLNKNNFEQYSDIIDIHESSEAMNYFKNRINANYHVINNAVEDFQDSILEVKKHKEIDSPFFLCVANYNDRKNQKMLIKAFSKVKKKNGTKFVFIGNGKKYAEEMRELVINLECEDDFVILENVQREITKKYIAGCYCVVLGSTFEVYPISIMEGMVCGHPFISTNVGCVSSIPGGIIVSNEEEMTSELQSSILEPQKIRVLGEECRKYAMCNYTQKEKIDQLNEIIIDTL